MSQAPPDDAALGDLNAERDPRAAERERHRGELMRQSQEMDAVGVLAGGVAHDFNNLLTVIRGHAENLRRSLPAGDQGVHRTDAILAMVDRAAALTAQLLAFGCAQPHQPQVLDLDAVVAGAEEMLGRLGGGTLQLARVPAPRARHIWADRGQIEQMLVNLVVNARDAMPDGGAIRIETAHATIDDALACRFGAAPGGHFTLVVRDEGAGMNEDVRAHLFEPFFTTKPRGKGTGLGLSAVYGIVKQSGGFIDVHSAPGQGTSVVVYFPECVVPGTRSEASTAQSPCPPDGPQTRTILLAEDEDDVRALVSDFLELQGYRVLTGSDGASALRQAIDHEGVIDLLLTDIVMPIMGGPELADRLTSEHPEARVLFMSGFAPEGSVALRTGAPLLRKPFSLDALDRAVRDSFNN